MSRKPELRYVPARELRVSAGPDGTTITGYAVVFNSKSVDLGGFREIVVPDALNGTLKNDIRLLANHDSKQLLGRTTSGTLKLAIDSVGLKFSCVLDPRSAHANEILVSTERNDSYGCSFGFYVTKDSWKRDGDEMLRTLESVSIFEISVCTVPVAYPATAVSVRNCPPELRSLLRSTNDDEDEDECDCDCPECLDGDCANCSDPDCYDEDCKHGENSARSVELWKLELRIALANRL